VNNTTSSRSKVSHFAVICGRGGDTRKSKPLCVSTVAGGLSILGDADEVRKSDERRKIVAALKETARAMEEGVCKAREVRISER
jgi:hypothetical protein